MIAVRRFERLGRFFVAWLFRGALDIAQIPHLWVILLDRIFIKSLLQEWNYVNAILDNSYVKFIWYTH